MTALQWDEMFALSVQPKDFLCFKNLIVGSILTFLAGFLTGTAYLMLVSEPVVLEAKSQEEVVLRQTSRSEFDRMALTVNLASATPQHLLVKAINETEISTPQPLMISIFQGGTFYLAGIDKYRSHDLDSDIYRIPLTAFVGFNLDQPFGKVELWFKAGSDNQRANYQVFLAGDEKTEVDKSSQEDTSEVASPLPEGEAVAGNASLPVANIVQPASVAVEPATTKINRRWQIQSVSSMKESKDRLCSQRDGIFIGRYVNKAKELGANYLAVETPYDSPACGSALDYTHRWVEQIRQAGLSVWHRHMPLAFEGIYDTPKKSGLDYLTQIENYIRHNPGLFKAGDIFTPIPEPQNGGIQGVTHCSQDVCQFSSAADFNLFLRQAIYRSRDAFAAIGLAGKIEIGYYGFDGFIAWGDNNPDWNGILEDETVKLMGNITIDHYPQVTGGNMAEDLAELNARYPGVPVVIGEWGSIVGGDYAGQVIRAMGAAAANSSVIGFNYWHLGAGGHEALIYEDFSQRVHFKTVQAFFLP